ncbi:MAG: DUF1574 family protein [Gemmataceae bacterium]
MKGRDTKRAKWALVWTAAVFVLSQLALNAYLEIRHPDLFDGEYMVRLDRLRRVLAEAPERPLLLLIGSSRTVMSFRPEILPPLYDKSGPVHVFNFSHIGAGPMMNLVELRRLLADGVQPRWLVLELMPPQMGDRRQSIAINNALTRDLPTLHGHYPALQLYGYFARNRALPAWKFRRYILKQISPALAPDAFVPREHVHIGPLGGDWSVHLFPDIDESRRRQEIDKAGIGYYPDVQSLEMLEPSCGANRDILRLCQEHGIKVVVLLTPEGPAFRSWYSAPAERRLAEYCAGLEREFGVPIVSARDWLEERDFVDSHHVILPGAEKFTRRLGAEVLEPLVQERPLSPESRRLGRASNQ